MADDKQIDFVDGSTAVTADWLDRMQEMHQPLAWNLNLSASGASLVLTAGSIENVASLQIKGKMRYVNVPLSINFTALAAGTYGIWANTTATDSAADFTIQAVAGTGTPSGVTFTRKIATVYWSGSTLQDLTLLSPYQKHSFMHRYGGPDALPPDSVGPEQIRAGSIGSTEYAANSIPPIALQDALLLRPEIIWSGFSTEIITAAGFKVRGQRIESGDNNVFIGGRDGNGNLLNVSSTPWEVNIYNTIGLTGYRRQYQLGVSYEMYAGFGTVSASDLQVWMFNMPNIKVRALNTMVGITTGGGEGATLFSPWIQPALQGGGQEDIPSGFLNYTLTSSGTNIIGLVKHIVLWMRYVRI